MLDKREMDEGERLVTIYTNIFISNSRTKYS